MPHPSSPPSAMIITGAAGFIGSHLTDRLLKEGHEVLGLDNMVRGRASNLDAAKSDPRFRFVHCDLGTGTVQQDEILEWISKRSVRGFWHLAANSDIGAGAEDYTIDLRDTFMTTVNSLELAKRCRIPNFYFASSSAIYGVHEGEIHENLGPVFPISNYGAMKLASEAAISAALESYLERAWIFRFPNVVGGRATHGALFDFVKKLTDDPMNLHVLGDGRQEKPYLHVHELLDAIFVAAEKSKSKLNFFNIGQEGSLSTVKFIAETAVEIVSPKAKIAYAGGSRGWVGDIPKFSLDITKIKSLGWKPRLDSNATVRQALLDISREFPKARG